MRQKKDFRCPNCGRLLLNFVAIDKTHIETKCPKCRKIAYVEIEGRGTTTGLIL